MISDIWLRTAYSYLYIRDFDGAKRTFQEAIVNHPNHAEYHFHASVTAFRSHDYDFALETAVAASQLEPDNELYLAHVDIVRSAQLVTIGRAKLSIGEWDEARRCFVEALERDPLNEQAHIGLQMLQTEGKCENMEGDEVT